MQYHPMRGDGPRCYGMDEAGAFFIQTPGRAPCSHSTPRETTITAFAAAFRQRPGPYPAASAVHIRRPVVFPSSLAYAMSR